MRLSVSAALLFFPMFLAAQPPADALFRSLETGRSAREAALGGKAIGLQDNDLNLGIFTPSLLGPSIHSQVALNYVNYFSDVVFGYAAYARTLKKVPLTVSGAVRYADYGDFTATDEFFNESGNFRASDIAFQAGAAWQADSTFTLGANLRYIQSALEGYKASGVGMDLSATYYNRAALFGATLLISDLGVVLNNYAGEKGKMPFNIAFGLSKKLAKSPLRFNIMLDNLTKWDLTYTDPAASSTIDPLTGQVKEAELPGFGQKLFRHFYGGAELVFSKNFHFRAGYNYRRRQELKIADRPGTAGLSWGFSFRVSKFVLSYARAKYHLAAPANHFTISTNLSTFGKNL